jgi:hypothetical protein
MGDDRSIVLNELRDAALTFIETGVGDPRLGIFEWSAPPGADPQDPQALAQANPEYGRHLDPDVLLGAAARAVNKGGEALTSFKTERMCIHVKMLDPAVDPGAWRRGLEPGDLAGARSRVALCLDVAPDGLHATLSAAAVLADDRVRVEVAAAWDGTGALERMRTDLPDLLTRIRPQAFGWFPTGPAAAVFADLAVKKGHKRAGWPPPGVKVQEIRAEVPAVCMGFAEQVTAGRILHSGDPLQDAHIGGAERLNRGDGWVFSRRGEGHVDAAYATAGAVHLARTLPQTVKPHLVVARDQPKPGQS